MAEKKKPKACVCPKCGQEPVIVKTRTWPTPWRVACYSLNCEYHDSAYGETEREAIEKWNRGEVVKA
jgi:hypothetical protein